MGYYIYMVYLHDYAFIKNKIFTRKCVTIPISFWLDSTYAYTDEWIVHTHIA